MRSLASVHRFYRPKNISDSVGHVSVAPFVFSHGERHKVFVDLFHPSLVFFILSVRKSDAQCHPLWSRLKGQTNRPPFFYVPPSRQVNPLPSASGSRESPLQRQARFGSRLRQ